MLFRIIMVVFLVTGLFAFTSESMVIDCKRSEGTCNIISSDIFSPEEHKVYNISDILSVQFLPINDYRGRFCNVAIITKNGTFNLYKADKAMKLFQGKPQKQIAQEFNTFINDKRIPEYNKKEETNKLLLAIICIPISLFILLFRRKR